MKREVKGKRITIRIAERDLRALVAKADKQGRSVGEVVRQLIAAGLPTR